jgi:hypothetical protein
LVLLEGEIPSIPGRDPHYTKRFYQSIQSFANSSLQLWEAGKIKKFDEHLSVAFRLFKEGNETVKNAIINVYLFTVSHALDKRQQLVEYAQKVFPKELMAEYHKFQFASGM